MQWILELLTHYEQRRQVLDILGYLSATTLVCKNQYDPLQELHLNIYLIIAFDLLALPSILF